MTLHAACLAGDVALVKALLCRATQAYRYRMLHARDSCGREPWECAVLSGSWDVLCVCLPTTGPADGQHCTPITAFCAAWRCCQPELCKRLLSMLPRGWFEAHARELLPLLVLKKRGRDMLTKVVLPTFGARVLLKASGVVSHLVATAIYRPSYLPPVDILRAILRYPVAKQLLRMVRVGNAERGCLPLHEAMRHGDECLPLLRVLLTWLQQRGDPAPLRAGDCLAEAVRGGSLAVMRFVSQFRIVWDTALPLWSRDKRLDAVTACFTREALRHPQAVLIARALVESPFAADRVHLGALTETGSQWSLARMACMNAPTPHVLGRMLRLPGVCGEWPSPDHGARALSDALWRWDMSRRGQSVALCAFHFDEGLGFASLPRRAQCELLTEQLMYNSYLVPYLLRQPCTWPAWCRLLTPSAPDGGLPPDLACGGYRAEVMELAGRVRRWQRRRTLVMLRALRDAGRLRPDVVVPDEPYCLSAWARARSARTQSRPAKRRRFRAQARSDAHTR